MRKGLFFTILVGALTLATGSALAVPAFTTTRVSVDIGGLEANAGSFDPDASSDGRYVVFESVADNLVPGDGNLAQDIFLKDAVTGGIRRVSVDSGGGEANGPSYDPAISPDGHFVVYSSDATDLVPGDVNGFRDVFLYDTVTGSTSISSVGFGGQGNGDSNHPKVSTDPVVAFDSVAFNLIPADANGAISDVFVRVVNSGATRLSSLSTGGVQGNSASTYPDITGSSNVVAFQSLATNLVAGDNNGFEDVFTHRVTGQTNRVSLTNAGMQSNGPSGRPDLTAIGNVITFHSDATNLVPGDVNGRRDVFVRNTPAATTTLMSTRGAVRGNGDSQNPSITESGRTVIFESLATNFVMGDVNGTWDVFARVVAGPALSCMSVSSGGALGDAASTTPAASENAMLQVIGSYESTATNLVAGDANAASDIFQRRP
jgi:Tol biopolymer transport system component